MAVDYAKTRVQFNRPIGSFQAIKHLCADLHVAVECARSAVYAAAAIASTSPASDELSDLASIASTRAGEAYFRAAAENLQIHGGVGFTWEHDAHLHLKRARAGLSFLGTPSFHRLRLASRLLDPTAPTAPQ